MKKTVVVLAVAATVCLSAVVFAQDAPGNLMVSISVPGLNLQVGAGVKDDLLAGTEKFAQGASKVTEINLNPSTMDMVGRTYGSGGDMTKKMKLMVVHTYGYDKPGMYRMEDVETYAKKLQDGSWSCPVVSREKEKDQEKLSYICTKSGTDQTNEMVVLTAEPQRLTFIHMAGTMSLNDLSHMSDSAHNLSRSVEPRGNQFINPKDFAPAQLQLQELRRGTVFIQPKAAITTGQPVPAAPPAPPAQ
jgi:uncharacterized protein DUF4252